ncbi:MAG TPA: condensation domain-containing protein, partial [Ktedonosporobacter sp.]|nr:condensation domain-containing protein [Ktedonosporobacter sp.]
MNDQLLKRIAGLSPEQRDRLLHRLNAGLEQQQESQEYASAIPRRKLDEPCFLSFAQQRLWFLDQLDEHSSQYSLCRAIHLTGELREEVLERSLRWLVQRHEILRTTFVVPQPGHEPVQVIGPVPATLLRVQDLTSLPASQRLAQAQAIARTQALHPFDLAQGPLAHWLLLRLEQD